MNWAEVVASLDHPLARARKDDPRAWTLIRPGVFRLHSGREYERLLIRLLTALAALPCAMMLEATSEDPDLEDLGPGNWLALAPGRFRVPSSWRPEDFIGSHLFALGNYAFILCDEPLAIETSILKTSPAARREWMATQRVRAMVIAGPDSDWFEVIIASTSA